MNSTLPWKPSDRRRSMRLKNHDYASGGAYFVTACTHNRVCLFGNIVDGRMEKNEGGFMVERAWDEIAVYYSGADIDAFVVMPNHIHGIVVLEGGQGCEASRLVLWRIRRIRSSDS